MTPTLLSIHVNVDGFFLHILVTKHKIHENIEAKNSIRKASREFDVNEK